MKGGNCYRYPKAQGDQGVKGGNCYPKAQGDQGVKGGNCYPKAQGGQGRAFLHTLRREGLPVSGGIMGMYFGKSAMG